MHVHLAVLLAAVLPAAGALLLDTAAGVAAAVKAGGWKSLSWQKFANVAEKSVAPLVVGVGGSLVQAFMSGSGAEGAAAATIIIANTVTARALADAKSKAVLLLA